MIRRPPAQSQSHRQRSSTQTNTATTTATSIPTTLALTSRNNPLQLPTVRSLPCFSLSLCLFQLNSLDRSICSCITIARRWRPISGLCSRTSFVATTNRMSSLVFEIICTRNHRCPWNCDRSLSTHWIWSVNHWNAFFRWSNIHLIIISICRAMLVDVCKSRISSSQVPSTDILWLARRMHSTTAPTWQRAVHSMAMITWPSVPKIIDDWKPTAVCWNWCYSCWSSRAIVRSCSTRAMRRVGR